MSVVLKILKSFLCKFPQVGITGSENINIFKTGYLLPNQFPSVLFKSTVPIAMNVCIYFMKCWQSRFLGA